MRTLVAIWGILILALSLSATSAQADAAITLSDITQETKLLDGWRHFPGQIVSPDEASRRFLEASFVDIPHVWGDAHGEGPYSSYGYGTYVLRLNTPGPAHEYGLRTGKYRAVYRLYAVVQSAQGGKQVYDLGGNGVPGEGAEAGASGRLFQADLPFSEPQFDLVVQVSNHIFPHAGFLWAPSIGPAKDIKDMQGTRVAGAFIFSGILGAMGVVCMFLALWHGSGRYYYIGGGLLIVLLVRSLMVDNYIWVLMPSMPLEWALRMEYIGLFLIMPGYYWLVTELYPEEASQELLLAAAALCGISLFVAFFAPIPAMFKLRDPYITLSVLMLFALLLVFWRARKNERDGATWALWGVLVAGCGAALDIYFYIPGPRTNVEAVPFAALAFTCVLLILFTVRYRKEQEERLFLATCLEKANVELKAHADNLDIAQAEAATALDMKNSFLSNISREVQTPLKAITEFSETLLSPAGGSLREDERAKYLNIIRDNGLNLARLMEDIISVSDLETGHFTVTPQAVDPRAVIDTALGFVEPVAHAKHLLIDVRCERIEMMIDRRLMRQALTKILSNAVKFSPNNGVVTVRGSKAGKDFVFTIMDTGPGMEASQIPVALSLFGRTGGREDAAIGLGLPLVARFMDLLGGGIQIDSIPDLGTTVTLSFPMKPKMQADDR
ncbi:MAG: hypothetical protein HWE25_03710 [Alphaproteobacteria bacterium]|nr:hypothetical protein [Alphaproteobacteria bacterium]